MLDQKLREFVEQPVMQVLATIGAGPALRCQIGRGSGARVDSDSGRLEVAVSGWQWPDTIDNLRRNPAVAITFMNPVDYTSFQLKGEALLRVPDDRDRALADAYIAATYRMMLGVGLPPISSSAFFSTGDLWMVSIRVDRIFSQTPGPLAGQAWSAP